MYAIDLCILPMILSRLSMFVSNIFAEGQHTLTKTIVTSKVSKLAMFTKKRNTCLGCKAVLDNNGESDECRTQFWV